jgi:hypothetical protein
MSELKLNNGASVVYEVFKNGVAIVNATPYEINIQDMDGAIKTVQPSVLINAKVVENQVLDLLVKTEFVGTDDGEDLLRNINNAWERENIVCDEYRGGCIVSCPYFYSCAAWFPTGGKIFVKKDTPKLIIVGSIIAAKAYPGKVVGMCPVPGYEKMTPSEKIMRCDKFIIF